MSEARDSSLSISVLTNCFKFEFDRAGTVYWCGRPEEHFLSAADCRAWNARWPGVRAFTSDNGKGYRTSVLTIRGVEYRLQLHRVLFAICNERWPLGQVDHIDGDLTNFDPRNFREVTNAENARNRARSTSNTSGKTGVYWFAPRSCWTAQIGAGGKRVSLGYFKTKVEAVAARRGAERVLGYTIRGDQL
jgi:hypothetical protein